METILFRLPILAVVFSAAVQQPQHPELCPRLGDTLICRGTVPESSLNSTKDTSIRSVEIHDAELGEIDLSVFVAAFPNLTSFSIFDSNVTRLTPPAPAHNGIRALILDRIGVESIGRTFLDNFPRLETLSLRGNFLQSLDGSIPGRRIKDVFLSGNKWNCSLDLGWMWELRGAIRDLDELRCFGGPLRARPLKKLAALYHRIHVQCQPGCSCSLPNAVLNPVSEALEPIIAVNCSHRGLTTLPRRIPAGTRILHVEGNAITDVAPLASDPSYRSVTDLYLDNNCVGAIEVLEGSLWLRHFRVLSLSGNRLPELPTYAMDNALQQNPNMPNAVRIFLGRNPWRCDCIFTPVFQEMLRKFSPQFRDIAQIKCSYVEGDENSLLPIIDLSRSSVCRLSTEYSIQALDLLNAVLASLILLVLGKLAYDYYYFKKTGKLPWIVTKMP